MQRSRARACDWAVVAFTAAAAASLVAGSSGMRWSQAGHPSSLVLDFGVVAATGR